jgi:hypothetical protein
MSRIWLQLSLESAAALLLKALARGNKKLANRSPCNIPKSSRSVVLRKIDADLLIVI